MDHKEQIEIYRSYAARWERGEQLLLNGELCLQDALRDAATAIETLLAERDAAVDELLAFRTCGTCKNSVLNRADANPCPFRIDCNGQYWEWRGPQKESESDGQA